MQNDKSIWLLEMEKKIDEIRARIPKSSINLLDLGHLLKIASIIDNEIINQDDKEVFKSNFAKYIELTEGISIHNPNNIRYGCRERILTYISPIRIYICENLDYTGYHTFRIDYTIYTIIFCVLMHICSYFKLFYWDIIASIIVCLSAFILGYISDKKRIKKGRVF